MPSTYFTADTHTGHGRIIDYCNRPFKSVEEMDETIIQRFNELLRPGDTLYHLGDVCWSKYNLDRFFGRLPGVQVHLIYGNHDKWLRKPKPQDIHRTICSAKDLDSYGTGQAHALLCHYPLRSWPGRGKGSYSLYGHCHGTLPGEGRQMDVGVDTNKFYPYHWDEICARLDKIEIGYGDSEKKGWEKL